jgi:hypothetical protein
MKLLRLLTLAVLCAPMLAGCELLSVMLGVPPIGSFAPTKASDCVSRSGGTVSEDMGDALGRCNIRGGGPFPR